MTFPEIESDEEVLLKYLIRFYKSDEQHLKDVASISGGKTIISLREMDFTVTKFCRKKENKHKVIYTLPDGTIFNLPLDYKAQLKGHSKKQFDPFCRIGDKKDTTRLERIFIDFESKTPLSLKGMTTEQVDEYRARNNGLVTNVGQLNFFRWAIINRVVEFCFKNKEAIVEEMDSEYRAKKVAKREKKNENIKNELNKNAKQKIVVQYA